MFNMRSPALNQANGAGLPVPWFERRRTPLIPELAPKIQSPAPDPKKPAICLEVTQSPAILFRIMKSYGCRPVLAREPRPLFRQIRAFSCGEALKKQVFPQAC